MRQPGLAMTPTKMYLVHFHAFSGRGIVGAYGTDS